MSSSNPVSHVRAGLALSGARALSSSEEIFRVLTAQTPVGIFVSSSDGKCEYVNKRWCELTGLTAEQALGDGWMAALHPDDAERVIKAWSEISAAGRDSVISEYRFLRPDGGVAWIEGYAAALRDDDDKVIGWVGTCLDMTARHAAEEAGVAASERFRAAFDNAPIGMGLVTPEGKWLQVNGAFCRLLGYSESELLTLNLADLTVPGDQTVRVDEDEGHNETRYLRSDGTPLWVAASTTLVRDANRAPLYYVVQIEDISDRRETESELRRLADHDSLTGLLNRRGFMEGLRRELRRMERKGEYGALLLLDLDNFKLVNDTAGHPAGDQVLRTTADVLRRRLRATDVIGRLGGDEFAAVVLNVTPRQAREIAEETTEAIRAQRITTDKTTLEVTASIGVVAIDDTSDESEDDLLAAADRAMYRAKSLRRDGS